MSLRLPLAPWISTTGGPSPMRWKRSRTPSTSTNSPAASAAAGDVTTMSPPVPHVAVSIPHPAIAMNARREVRMPAPEAPAAVDFALAGMGRSPWVGCLPIGHARPGGPHCAAGRIVATSSASLIPKRRNCERFRMTPSSAR